MKKYVVVIPVRKEAYVKEFSGRDSLTALIADKVGSKTREIEMIPEFGEEYKIIASELKSGAENEVATYISALPETENIYGPALILATTPDGDAGCAFEIAVSIRDFVRNLRM